MQQAGTVRTKAKDVQAEAEENRVIRFMRDVLKIVTEQKLSGIAQMVAYNVLFATAPTLMVITAGAAALTRAINSDLQNPAQPILDWMQDTLPADTSAFLTQPIERAVNADTTWLFSVGALLALWGARGAIGAVIRGLNVSYGYHKDPRGLVKVTVVSITLTLLLVAMIVVAGLVFTLGTDLGVSIASSIGLGSLWASISYWLRWPLVVVIAVFAIMVLHRFGTAEPSPFREYWPGALFTVVAGYIATIGLSWWLQQSQGFAEAYGIFGSVLAFVMWLYIVAFIVLLGGAINAVLHERTIKMTSDRKELPV